MPQQSSPLEVPPAPGGAGILVVDEDPAFQLGLKTVLREYVGFAEVFAASSGAEALELIRKEDSIEVITLDYQMPGMTGIELLEQLSEAPPRLLSVLMITGYPSEELESQFVGFNSDLIIAKHFLAKPVEFEKLEPLVLNAHEELIARKQQDEETGDEEEEEIFIAPGEAIPRPRLDKRLGNLDLHVTENTERLEKIEGDIKRLKSQWRFDFVKLLILAGLVWAAIHFDWGSKISAEWDQFRADFRDAFQTVPDVEADEVAPSSDEPTEALEPGKPL